jgi:hypothetical protein
MLIQDQLTYDTTGRRAVEARMQLIHGDVIIVKAKASIASSISQLKGKELSPAQAELMFGSMIYPDWGGELNMIDSTSVLLELETNQASCYLVFKPQS